MLDAGLEVGVLRRPLAVRRLHEAQITHNYLLDYQESLAALLSGRTPPREFAAAREQLARDTASYLWKGLQPQAARKFILQELGPKARLSALYALSFLPVGLLSAAKALRRRCQMRRYDPRKASLELQRVYAIILPLLNEENNSHA